MRRRHKFVTSQYYMIGYHERRDWLDARKMQYFDCQEEDAESTCRQDAFYFDSEEDLLLFTLRFA